MTEGEGGGGKEQHGHDVDCFFLHNVSIQCSRKLREMLFGLLLRRNISASIALCQ